MCCFDDSAYFTTNRCYDFVLIFFRASVVVMLRKRDYIQKRLNYKVVFFIPTGIKKTIDILYVPDGLPSYLALNQVYIGLNEKEFGFMDDDLSYERNWDDIINRVEDYGPTKLTKIIGKKLFGYGRREHIKLRDMSLEVMYQMSLTNLNTRQLQQSI